MGNMSYCRYRNTLGDLRDCYEAMCDEFDGETLEKVGEDESDARLRLIKLCVKIADEFGEDV